MENSYSGLNVANRYSLFVDSESTDPSELLKKKLQQDEEDRQANKIASLKAQQEKIEKVAQYKVVKESNRVVEVKQDNNVKKQVKSLDKFKNDSRGDRNNRGQRNNLGFDRENKNTDGAYQGNRRVRPVNENPGKQLKGAEGDGNRDQVDKRVRFENRYHNGGRKSSNENVVDDLEEKPKTDSSNDQVEVPKVEEPKECTTLDEWKAKLSCRAKPQHNVRKAGDGEDQSQWKNMVQLIKKKEEKEIKVEFDRSEFPQRVGKQKRVLDIAFEFNDGRRLGGAGRGRGGPRADRGSRFPRSVENKNEDVERHQPVIKVEDEFDFPNLH